ncbi:MAG TPA: hypothetical protein VMU85_21640 [Stellaceae bacterium]|nr:hypothetical protein [Stellaceae bacterium]
MSIAVSDDATQPQHLSPLEAAREGFSRVPLGFRLLLAAWLILVAGHEISLVIFTPAQRIRHELQATASELKALPWTRADDRVISAVARNFGDRAYQLDASRYPRELTVTLLSLDRRTCLDARDAARRIEGRVVIALEGYESATDCRADNTMAWHIMP